MWKNRTTSILRLNDSIDQVGVDVQRLYHARRENLQQRSTDVNKNSFTNDNLCDMGSDLAGNQARSQKWNQEEAEHSDSSILTPIWCRHSPGFRSGVLAEPKEGVI